MRSRILLLERTPGLVVLILAAVGLTAALSLSSAAQNGVADLDPADCSNGTFVPGSTAAPGLVADYFIIIVPDTNIPNLQ